MYTLISDQQYKHAFPENKNNLNKHIHHRDFKLFIVCLIDRKIIFFLKGKTTASVPFTFTNKQNAPYAVNNKEKLDIKRERKKMVVGEDLNKP